LTERPSIAVVIPARDSQATIERAVRASLAQEGARVVEVVVVDDGSSDETARVAEQAGARVIRRAPAGPAAARNTGWRSTQADIVAFTDSDCEPNPHWCARIAEALADEKVGAVGGSYDIANPESPLARVVHAEILARHARMGRFVRALGTYNFAARREVLERLDGFDESYTNASGEDNDLSYRMLASGLKLLFLPANTVLHVHPTRLWGYLKSQARHGYWRVKLYRDHPGMKSGDDYSDVADYVAPLFGLAALVLAAAAVALWSFFLLTHGAQLPYLVLELDGATVFCYLVACACGGPVIARIRRTEYAEEAFAFFWLNGVRAVARGVGLAAGVLRFGFSGRKGTP